MTSIGRKITAIAAAMTLTACIMDRTPGPDGQEIVPGRPAVLTFTPRMSDHRNTRAAFDDVYELFRGEFAGAFAGDDIFGDGTPADDTDDGLGRAADRKISTFRVLVYHSADNGIGTAGELVKMGGKWWNYHFDWKEGITEDEQGKDNFPPFEIEVATGKYDFVFIANENSLTTPLGLDSDGELPFGSPVATLDEIKAIRMTYGNDIAGTLDIPMVSIYSNVSVSANNTVSYPDPDRPNEVDNTVGVDNSEWDVKLRRAAIRLSMGIQMAGEEYRAWKNYHAAAPHATHGSAPLLYLSGLKTEGFLFPSTAAVEELDRQAIHASATPVAATPGKIIEQGAPTNGAYIFFDRMIYPELNPADIRNSAGAVRATLHFDYGGETTQKQIVVSAPDPSTSTAGYSILRNTWVWVSANVRSEVDVTVRVVPWGEGPLSGVTPDQRRLTTDRSEYLIRGEGATEVLFVTSDHPDGWEISGQEPAGSGSVPEPYTIPSWITPVKSGDNTVRITIARNDAPGAKIRTGHFTLRAGNLYKRIAITQMPANGVIEDDTPPVTMYAGAFWRASQYGERLIDIPSTGGAIDGPWAAYVIEGDDWIVMDTAESGDLNKKGNDAGFDSDNRLTGYATSVSGQAASPGGIYFRVGLNGVYTPTAARPARYGMILLSYTDNSDSANPRTAYRRIWVRQGEGADYIVTAPGAARFAPYNVTLHAGASYTDGWATIPARADGGRTGGGAFTAYPSQAGAMLRFSSTAFPRHAYSPVGLFSPTGFSWAGTDPYDPATMEVCPPGYRRPTAGATDGEMLLSLSLSGEPQDGTNTVWGYYADGLFDRGTIAAEGSVGADERIAWQGRVVFNDTADPDGTHYAASVFFPAAGVRWASNSYYVSEAGETGYYISSSPSGEETAYGAIMTNSGVSFSDGTVMRNPSYSMRCVRSEEPMSTFTVTPAGQYHYAGETKTLEVVSTSAEGHTVGWRVTGYSTDGGATWLPTGRPEWLAMPTAGSGGVESIDVSALAIAAVTTNPEDTSLRSAPRMGTAAAPHDLSMDYDGTLRNTANSYVVNGPGYYMLPLVYGNAIKDGVPNRGAWDPAVTGANVLTEFIKHDGTAITGPAITGATGATLVWMDSPGLVTDVRLVGDNLAFDVPAHTIVQGNAVVAATDASGTVLWSWHIWVTPEGVFNPRRGAASTTSTIRGLLGIYQIANYNLGWVTPAERTYTPRSVRVRIEQQGSGAEPQYIDVAQNPGGGGADGTLVDNSTFGRNPFWQWGRKDPMPPGDGMNDFTENGLIQWGGGFGFQPADFSTASLATAIQNPTTFYDSGDISGYGNWQPTYYKNLWDAENSTDGDAIFNDINIVKTVYDPNPAGYKMPPAETWKVFTKTNANTNVPAEYNVDSRGFQNGGYHFHQMSWKHGTPVFYPAPGNRQPHVDGRCIAPGLNGIYWSALSHSSTQGSSLVFRNWNGFYDVNPMFIHNLAAGYAVRPIADQKPEIPRVYAAPGVIGIKKSAYDRLLAERERRGDPYWYFRGDADVLTIRGSSTYSTAAQGGNPLVQNIAESAEFAGLGGGLEDEPVYTVYFKWGSMVAMIGGAGDTWSADDVVWVNSGFTGTIDNSAVTGTIDNSVVNTPPYGYGNFAPAAIQGTNASNVSNVTPNPAQGHGDPCTEVLGGWWRTPSNNTWTMTRAYSGSYTPMGSYYGPGAPRTWELATGTVTRRTDEIDVGLAETSGGAVSDDGSLFLPITGNRGHRGSVSYRHEQNGARYLGVYWMSSIWSGNQGHRMWFDDGHSQPSGVDLIIAGYAIRCVEVNPQAQILYFEGTGVNTRLALAPWGSPQLNRDNYKDRLAFFKFGGVVGITVGEQSESFELADIKFNPMATPGSITRWADAITGVSVADQSIPSVPGYLPDDFTANRLNISLTTGGTAYHTFANIKAGKGDPCQLVGLTEAQIRGAANAAALTTLLNARPAEYRGWRMPTNDENNAFINGDFTVQANGGNSANPPTYTFIGPTARGVTLPAAGRMSGTGSANLMSTNGNYISSTVFDQWGGYHIGFVNGFVRNEQGTTERGWNIRCVPDTP